MQSEDAGSRTSEVAQPTEVRREAHCEEPMDTWDPVNDAINDLSVKLAAEDAYPADVTVTIEVDPDGE
jgi:hypothetical protein